MPERHLVAMRPIEHGVRQLGLTTVRVNAVTPVPVFRQGPPRYRFTVGIGAIVTGFAGVAVVFGPVTASIAALAGLALLVFALQAALLALSLIPPRADTASQKADRAADGPLPMPVFSVHMPIHNEPPALVIASLKALAAQSLPPAHDVIVLDNNTADPAVWKPVADWCHAQGHPFRFVHRMGVKGAKAGALNIALAMTPPDATHIIVIDADYQVRSGFLALAAKMAARGRVGLWQFPQAYRNADIRQNGVALELGDYFFGHARGVADSGAMLPTGTLSIIDRAALRAVGNWTSQTKTEDAELGLRLLCAGYRTRFVPQVVGDGLLPLDMPGLRIQRRRWAGGNTRAMWLLMTGQLGTAGPLARRDWLPVARQLTAWANLTVPAAVLLGLSGAALTLGPAPGLYLAAGASAACLILSVGWQAVTLWQLGARVGAGPATRLTAIATRVALMPASSLETLAAVLPRAQVFAVTPKALRANPHFPRRARLVALGARLSAIALVTGLLWLLIGQVAAAVGACMAAGLWLAALTTTESLEGYAQGFARPRAPVIQPARAVALRHRARSVAGPARRPAIRLATSRKTQPQPESTA